MNRNKMLGAVLCAAVLIGSQSASAHHSFAMFDQKNVKILKGVSVEKFQWANPHVYLVVKSQGSTFTLECNSPSNMSQVGWKFNTLKPGDTITIAFFPLRNGKPGGALKVATLKDGRSLDAW